MKQGAVGLALFAIGSLVLLVYSPLFSPDLAGLPPGPINLPRYTLLYYLPRVAISVVISGVAVFIVFTDVYSKQDKYWAYGLIGAVLTSWVFWTRG
jgi:hypothetical protein